MTKPLIQLENVDVALDGQTILRDINWRLAAGEHWAILGGNGSGKTTLLRLIRGELWPVPRGNGRRVYAFGDDEQITAVGIKEKIALVSPELQERYLQQEWKLTGLQVIHSGFFNTDYVCQRPSTTQRAFARSVIRLLGVEHLLARNVQQLSTGELRKVLIVRALAGRPHILICDEICDGVDARSRTCLLDLLERVARAGTQILYSTHRADEMISAITHVLVLERGRIAQQGRLSGFGDLKGHSISKVGKLAAESSSTGIIKSAPASARRVPSPILIRIHRADVLLERKRVLHDIHWEMEEGHHWVIVGPNGSGKTTLLKLIFGDLHPAVGGRIQRFDFTPANSVWELKKNIGYVSPDFQANYREALTGADVIASGFFSAVGLPGKVTRGQQERVRALLDAFHLGALAKASTDRMSYGEFRQLLLLRALVNSPKILLCDEPFDGLDATARKRFTEALQRVVQIGTPLIVVTHHVEDLPACITHGLLLDQGRIICQGELAKMRSHRAARRLFNGT